MPWNVVKDDRCPADKPWGVVGGRTGNRLAGCHPSKESARQQQAALYVNEAKSDQPVAYTTPTTEVW